MTSEDESEPGRHYFSPEQRVESSRSQVTLLLPDLGFELTTDRGVFGRSQVDAGTKLLLLDGPSPEPSDQHLADLGCGYGPIALALAKRNPQATVWAIEVNERARALCQENADRYGLANVKVIAPEQFPADVALDRIWSNPPIRVGKAALHDLLILWFERCGPAASAHLVVQKHLGADSLQRWMSSRGWPTNRRASKAAFRLLDVDLSRGPA